MRKITKIIASLCAVIAFSVGMPIAANLANAATSSVQAGGVTGEPFVFRASTSTKTKFYCEDNTATYTANKDLPDNAIYKLNALKLENPANGQYTYLKLDYTAADIEALKSTYKGVRFYIYCETQGSLQNGDRSNASSPTQEPSLFSVLGITGSNRAIERNIWHERVITLDQLITIMNSKDDDDTTALILRHTTNTTNTPVNLYIGDVTFVK